MNLTFSSHFHWVLWLFFRVWVATFLVHRCQNLIAGWWILSETHLSICRLSDYQIIRLSGRHQNPLSENSNMYFIICATCKVHSSFCCTWCHWTLHFWQNFFPSGAKGESSAWAEERKLFRSWLIKQSLSKAGGTPSQIPQPPSVLVGEPG